jgi:hypothetical protein
MKEQREKLVKMILDELENLAHQKSINYVEKVTHLPPIDPKETELLELVQSFHFQDDRAMKAGLVPMIKKALFTVNKKHQGTRSCYASVIESIVEAFTLHSSPAEPPPNTTSKVLLPPPTKRSLLSRDSSEQSISGSNAHGLDPRSSLAKQTSRGVKQSRGSLKPPGPALVHDVESILTI